MRVLILGGTTEATALARRLAGRADIEAALSLAGRTSAPAESPLPTRVGGFGGVEGLAGYLRSERIDAVVDATHPFAAQMSRHAVAACREMTTPLLVYTRPEWRPGPGDRWTTVPDMPAAVEALGVAPRTVFLTVGRLSFPEFFAAPQHRYVARSIDAPDGLDRLPRCELVLARGPFDVEAEAALMQSHGVDVLVTKNSGGAATAAKLEAGRRLGVEVVMVARPAPSGAPVEHHLDAVLAWLEAHRPAP
ncbi:cobalt-precorrin-6A reductase [Alsobacter soli]|uniref:Cobalt-precorrin-6A reductase n=1 Tax=Alsobacter soli TaxID=2109933 RepID=A0A2T1HYB6_9HYPH|nr:cobalt-precorrin-6A reductase [Alsobacter soli]PSC06687.1 cobalt-precorrin-6A reductase [Alsobacter soli]